MTAVAIRYAPAAALSLPRIGAWSASITIHVVALAMLLSAPIAYQLVREAPKEETIVTRFIEEKPIPVVEDLKPPPPIVHHEKKALPPAPPTAPTEVHETTPMSKADTTVAPPAIETGPTVPALPDTEPTAVGYGMHASVAYPHDSLKAREQGTVMLLVLVGLDGKVEDIKIDKSSGYARLDRAALNAVKTWSFNPARHGGIAERAWAKVPISFTLSTL
jgi:periplasmic protein TonB